MNKHASNHGRPSKPQYLLHLYISGATSRSRRALTNIKQICDQHLTERYDLQVFDIYQTPDQLLEDNVIAAPTLIKKTPLPVRRFIGDLSDTEKVIRGLEITEAA